MTKSSENHCIQPVYFPFTYISPAIAQKIYSVLGRVIVYQPVADDLPEELRRLSESGRIAIRVPVSADTKRLKKLTAGLRDWGRLHEGQGRVFKERADAGFYSHEFTAQVRSEILKDQPGFEPTEDPLFSARLFLLLAQEYDIQKNEVDSRLAAARADQLNLFSRLGGDSETRRQHVEPLSADDTGEYMTGPRIYAWLRLMQADAEKSPVLITTSRPCFNQLIDYAGAKDGVSLLEGGLHNAGDDFSEGITAALIRLAQTDWPKPDRGWAGFIESKEAKLVFSELLMLPGVSPDDLVAGCMKQTKPPCNPRFRNTLVGLIPI